MNIKDLSKTQLKTIYTGIAIIIIAIVYISFNQYQQHKTYTEMSQASEMYQEALIKSENPNISDTDNEASFSVVMNKYPKTSFGIFSSWQIADIYITPNNLTDNKLNFINTLNALNYTKAINVLKQSINDNPNNSLTVITKTRLARIYLQNKQPDDAIKTLSSLDNNDNAYPLMILAQAYIQKKDTEKAIATLQQAEQASSTDTQLKSIITQQINSLSISLS